MGKTSPQNCRKRREKLQHIKNGLNPRNIKGGFHYPDITQLPTPKPGEQSSSIRTESRIDGKEVSRNCVRNCEGFPGGNISMKCTISDKNLLVVVCNIELSSPYELIIYNTPLT